MHNQSINSLALISARYTATAVELASLMCASYIYTLCQALDLRVLQFSFFQSLEHLLYTVNKQSFGPLLCDLDFSELHLNICHRVQANWLLTANKDSEDRCTHVVESTIGVIVKSLLAATPQAKVAGEVSSAALTAIREWKGSAHKTLGETFAKVRASFYEKQDTTEFLGLGSRALYTYIREKLEVPFHRGLEDHPEPHDVYAADGSKKRTIGSNISTIYEALRTGEMHKILMECLMGGDATATTTSHVDLDERNGVGNGVASSVVPVTDIRNGRTS